MKIGDLVSRYSYKNDIIFRIIDKQNDKYILQGEEYRLIADADGSDLKVEEIGKINVQLPSLVIKREANCILGKVLHLDGDAYYLKKAMEAYQEYNIPAMGYYVQEKNMPYAVKTLLKRDNYDILVLTGHDGYLINAQDKNNILTTYRNSSNYLFAVKEARSLYQDKDSLVIIAGACQSNYELLIAQGANFASSPNRKNIHLLDPIIIASSISRTLVNEYAPVRKIINSTLSKEIGGIDTKGKARRNYTGGNLQ